MMRTPGGARGGRDETVELNNEPQKTLYSSESASTGEDEKDCNDMLSDHQNRRKMIIKGHDVDPRHDLIYKNSPERCKRENINNKISAAYKGDEMRGQEMDERQKNILE